MDEPAQETQTADAEQQASDAQDAILDDLLPKDEPGETTEDPTPETLSEELAEANVAAIPTEDQADVDPDDLIKGMNALRRNPAFDNDELDAMSPVDVVRRGLPLAEQQAKVDGYGQENATLKKQLDELKAGKEVVEPVIQTIDLDRPLEQIAETYGEDLAKPLRAFAQQLIDATSKQQPAPEMDSGLLGRIDSMELAGARQQIAKTYSQINDKDGYETVVGIMDKLNPDSYDSKSAMMTDAAKFAFENEVKAEKQADKEKLNRAKSDGQASMQSSNTPPKSLSSDQKMDATLDEVFDKHGI